MSQLALALLHKPLHSYLPPLILLSFSYTHTHTYAHTPSRSSLSPSTCLQTPCLVILTRDIRKVLQDALRPRPLVLTYSNQFRSYSPASKVVPLLPLPFHSAIIGKKDTYRYNYLTQVFVSHTPLPSAYPASIHRRRQHKHKPTLHCKRDTRSPTHTQSLTPTSMSTPINHLSPASHPFLSTTPSLPDSRLPTREPPSFDIALQIAA